MIKSMTGFGRATVNGLGRNFIVEVKAVNHRYLDLNIKLPRTLVSLEEKVRTLISGYLTRGKVDVFVSQSIFDRNDAVANFNESLGDSYYKCLSKIKERYNLKDDISISLLTRMPEVITLEQKDEDLDSLWLLLKGALEEALTLLTDMRKREGQKLYEDINKRCNNTKELLDKINERAPFIASEYKEKLNQRLNELLGGADVDEARVAMEVAVFADKSNIDEEIVRLNSHIVQMKETLLLNEPVGRKLDFLVQEMNRESNTIASKANDLQLVNHVLSIKNEIEKIREQIQNIE